MQHPDVICYLALSPDEKRMVTTGFDDKTSIWDITTGQLVTAPVLRSEPNFLYAAGWSPDGSRIVGASYPDFVAPIWDVDTSQIITTVGTGRCFMHYPVWAPQGDRFMTGCVYTPEIMDNTPATIYGYDGKVLMELESRDGETVRGEWSPDGKRLAVAYENGKAKVWDAATGKELTEFAGHTTWLWDVTWSPDGKRIASADANGIVKVWDAATGEEVMKFQAPGTVLNVDWSPDGQSLIAAGFFNSPIIKRVWQSTDELIQYAKECCVFRELTAAEREQFGLAAK